MLPPSVLRVLGEAPYAATFAAMQDFTTTRDAATADEFWLVTHPPVFTLGLAADLAHLLRPRPDIPLVQVDRGGEITYHGPGQAVVYTLLDLRRAQVFVRDWVKAIEAATIAFLAQHHVPATRRMGAPGVYIEAPQTPYHGAKIAALGLKVKRGACYHGAALNIAMDLSPFLHINPCGMADLAVVDMATIAPLTNPFPTLAEAYAKAIQQEWDRLTSDAQIDKH